MRRRSGVFTARRPRSRGPARVRGHRRPPWRAADIIATGPRCREGAPTLAALAPATWRYGPLQLAGGIAGDGDLLDLGAAFDDLGDLGVAPVALDGMVLGEAVGAVQLDGVVGGADGGAGGEVLGDQGFGGGVVGADEAAVAGLVAEEAGGAGVDDHLGELA